MTGIFLLVLHTLHCSFLAQATVQVPGVAARCYTQPGDVLFGMLSDDYYGCQYNDLRDRVENMEAMKYVVDMVNRDDSILPNITLGFVVLDSCTGNGVGSIATITHFIPDDDTLDPWDIPRDCTSGLPHFKVIGVLGAPGSRDTMMIAPLLSALEIPVLSTYATSDDLSDATSYGYFVRMSPPDRYQSEAILDLLVQLDWTYIALIYSEDSYGQNGAKHIQQGAEERGLCIAMSEMIYWHYTTEDVANVFRRLEEDGRVRTVIIFGYGDVLEAVPEHMYGRFLWVGSDGLSYDGYGLVEEGALIISFPEGGDEAFDEYTATLAPRGTNNLFFRELWQQDYNCRWNRDDCTGDSCQDCHAYENETLGSVDPARYKTLDAVRAMVFGLDALLRDNCSGVFSNTSLLDDCLSGPAYLAAILGTSFNGTSGHIAFDESGDMYGQYGIKQYSSYRTQPGIGQQVGTWTRESRELDLHITMINWTAFDNFPNIVRSEYVTENVTNDERISVPESVCSYPCPARYYYIEKDLPCCWECRECRDNEIITENATACQACPENTWPDDATATYCMPIPPNYLKWTDPIGLALLSVNSVGIVAAIAICIISLSVRHKRLIKASSPSLMSLILFGIFLALLTVFVIMARPSAVTCGTVQFGFIVSVSVIYAPLMVKTNRVYRIFSAGRKGRTASFVSTRLQLLFSACAIGIQLILTTFVSVFLPPEASVRMPVTTERYCELYCDLPLTTLGFLLAYNLGLLLLCALFGFLTRKLPENFNEAWYIFVSVTTTLFLWMVFLPTYFTAFYAVHQAALLATCLILNAVITLACLFLPKIYAVYNVEESTMKFVTNTTASTVANEPNALVNVPAN